MNKKQLITKLLKTGKSYKTISKRVGCSKSTISYHAKKLGLNKPETTYNWDEVQEYYKDHTMSECVDRFGMARSTWSRAKRRGNIRVRKRRIPDHKFFIVGNKRSGKWLHRRLIEDNHKLDLCEECGLKPKWNGKSLTLHVDHINGNKRDNRLENLRIICPNCHQQTPNWGGKNIKY